MLKLSKYLLFRYIFTVFISTCIFSFSSAVIVSNGFAGNSTAKIFIKAFDQFAKVQPQPKTGWFDVTSPWAPYLKQPFSKGLSQDQYNQSLSLERQGRCDEVLTHIQNGFYKLYPDLALIFLKPKILDVFEDGIALRFSNRYRRCVAWRNLHFVIERSKRRSLDYKLGPFLDLPYPHFKQIPEVGKNKDKRFKLAVFKGLNGLVRLGLCQTDKASLKDLDYLSLKLYPWLFSESEALYMDALSARHGVKSKHYERVKQRLNDGKGPKPVSLEPQKVLSMQARLQAGNFQQAKLLVPSLIKLCEQEVKLTP